VLRGSSGGALAMPRAAALRQSPLPTELRAGAVRDPTELQAGAVRDPAELRAAGLWHGAPRQL